MCRCALYTRAVPLSAPPSLRALLILAVLLCLPWLAGCAHTGHPLGYYWQSVRGHVGLMQAAAPVADWLERTDLPPALRERLALAQQARNFAVAELHLPDNASYRRYADLRRSAAVWNVVAAPPHSLTLHTWCFAVTGCIGYRGYFNEADARAEATRLAAQGLETEVYGVPAYSTLGYLNWAGGDPLLSTFVHWPEGDFVRLMFHELAHQVVYAEGDTLFNESFATAVERLGVQRWLAQPGHDAARRSYATSEERRHAFRALTAATREQLAQIYEQKTALPPDHQVMNAMKLVAMDEFRKRYAQLRGRWQAGAALSAAQLAGYDRWVQQANNASFAAQAAYHQLAPAFEALFEQEGQSWPRFYDAVRALARQPHAARHEALRALTPKESKETPGA